MEGVEPEVPSAHATNDDLRNDAPTLTHRPQLMRTHVLCCGGPRRPDLPSGGVLRKSLA
jgi:hypothetical protein